jgi:hypothetical protein
VRRALELHGTDRIAAVGGNRDGANLHRRAPMLTPQAKRRPPKA